MTEKREKSLIPYRPFAYGVATEKFRKNKSCDLRILNAHMVSVWPSRWKTKGKSIRAKSLLAAGADDQSILVFCVRQKRLSVFSELVASRGRGFRVRYVRNCNVMQQTTYSNRSPVLSHTRRALSSIDNNRK